MASNKHSDLGFQPAGDHDDLGFIPAKSEPGMGEKILNGVAAVGRGIDAVSGAPTRAAIYAAQNGGSPLSAAIHQFGDSQSAPTGAQIAAKAGVPTQPLAESDDELPNYPEFGGEMPFHHEAMKYIPPHEGVGLGVDMAANPLNAVGAIGPAAKAVGGAAKAAEELPVVGGIARLANAAAEVPGKLATKAAHWVTNQPEHAIEVYSDRAPEVRKLLQDYGGEMPTAADALKEKITSSVQAKKDLLNQSIKSSLSDTTTKVDSAPILEKLLEVRSQIDPHYYPEQRASIDEIINTISTKSPDGKMSLQDLYSTKKYLQDMGSGAYVKNGQIFNPGDQASRAFAGGAREARELLHDASPAIKQADNDFSELHDIQGSMSRNLLGTGKAENVFASAGSGGQNVHQAMLRRIGELTGTDPVKDAELLYAAKNFKTGPESNFQTPLLRTALDFKHGVSGAIDAVPAETGAAANLATQGASSAQDVLNKYRALSLPRAASDDGERERIENLLNQSRSGRSPSNFEENATRYVPEKEAQDMFLKGN